MHRLRRQSGGVTYQTGQALTSDIQCCAPSEGQCEILGGASGHPPPICAISTMWQQAATPQIGRTMRIVKRGQEVAALTTKAQLPSGTSDSSKWSDGTCHPLRVQTALVNPPPHSWAACLMHKVQTGSSHNESADNDAKNNSLTPTPHSIGDVTGSLITLHRGCWTL